MISVIVPVANEPPESIAFWERFARLPEAELLIARDTHARRGRVLAQAAERAKGEILFFCHADSRPPADALAIVREAIAAGAAAGAFSLAYEDADGRMRWIAWWANLRSRWLRLPFGDQGIFCRRDAYERAGGFRDLAVCDDLDLVRRLRRAGPFVIRPELVVTSSRAYRRNGILRQVLRVWTVATGYFLGVSPARLQRWYTR